ncbi:hypothetical protein D3C87_1312260 [compost metagenome]
MLTEGLSVLASFQQIAKGATAAFGECQMDLCCAVKTHNVSEHSKEGRGEGVATLRKDSTHIGAGPFETPLVQ